MNQIESKKWLCRSDTNGHSSLQRESCMAGLAGECRMMDRMIRVQIDVTTTNMKQSMDDAKRRMNHIESFVGQSQHDTMQPMKTIPNDSIGCHSHDVFFCPFHIHSLRWAPSRPSSTPTRCPSPAATSSTLPTAASTMASTSIV